MPEDDPEKDERCRNVERGSRIVTAIPTNMSIVLQMPRGNLETIFPRAMVLAGIRQLIEEKDYGRAFSYCRTQRVDMNILYDHRPEQFLANVGLFLDQLKDVAHIDLFLSSLRYVLYTLCPVIFLTSSQGRRRHADNVPRHQASKAYDGGYCLGSSSPAPYILQGQHDLRCSSQSTPGT